MLIFFSCPSSSMPTCVTDSFTVLNSVSEIWPNLTKPTWPTFPTYFPKSPELPSHLANLPTWPTHPPSHQTDFKHTHPDNLLGPTHNLPEPTRSFRILTKPYKAIPSLTSPTKFHNFYEIWQCWPNLTILTESHNFDKSSQFWPNFTIWTKLHNLGRSPQFL